MVNFQIAKAIHDQRLHEAQEKQRHRQPKPVAPFHRKRLLLRIGALLFAFANRLIAFRGKQATAQVTLYGLKLKRVEGEGL